MKNHRLHALLLLCLTSLTFGAWGCGQSTSHLTVKGMVFYDDQPLTTGWITFFGDRGAAGSGAISHGSFQLQESGSQSGILPGTYQVVIESWKEEPGKLLPSGVISTGVSNIPKKYQSAVTSGLTATIDANNRSFDFNLSSKP